MYMFKRNKRFAVSLLVGAMILSSAVPVFAGDKEKGEEKVKEDRGSFSEKVPQPKEKEDKGKDTKEVSDFKVTATEQEGTVSGGLPQLEDKVKNKEAIKDQSEQKAKDTKEKSKEETKKAFGQSVSQIKQIQGEEKKQRGQINSLRHRIENKIRQAQSTQNYDVLVLALDNLIVMQEDIATLQGNAQTTKADWDQLMIDKKSGDLEAVKLQLEKLQIDAQIRLETLEKILVDMEAIMLALETPVPTEESTPTEEGTPAEEGTPTEEGTSAEPVPTEEGTPVEEVTPESPTSSNSDTTT